MKRILFSVAAISGFLPAAKAQITFTDIADVQLNVGGLLYIDFDTGTTSSSSFGGVDLYFNRVSSENAYIYNHGDWSTAGAFTGTNFTAYRYSSGASLDFNSVTPMPWLEHNGNGPWDGDDGSATAYIAVLNTDDSRTAWIGIRYDDGDSLLTIESFAVAPGAQNMTAGQTAVPEPAETALMMALLAGGAAAWNRRRKVGSATAVSR